jgi:hypothetical protein
MHASRLLVLVLLKVAQEIGGYHCYGMQLSLVVENILMLKCKGILEGFTNTMAVQTHMKIYPTQVVSLI